jgi:hypothetical protein
VQFGDKKGRQFKKKTRLLLQYHMAVLDWATSAVECHVAPSYWSTSASGLHHGTSNLTSGPHHSATWQPTNGPPHPAHATWHNHNNPPHLAYATWQAMTGSPHPSYATWHSHDSVTSLNLCHMVGSDLATSVSINKLLGLKKRVLNLAINKILPSQLN